MKPSEIVNQLDEATVITDDTGVDEVLRYYNAARRGLGIANKLRDPIDRKKHASAVMKNLNLCKAALMRLTTKVDELKQEAEQL